MNLGVDSLHIVRLVSDGPLPSKWNFINLTIYELTEDQELAFQTLSPSRGGTLFDGVTFTEIPAPPPKQPPTADELEAEVQQVLSGGSGLDIDWQKLIRAKFISDLAFRLGVAPGALTNAQLLAERNRIAAIYKNLP